VNVTSATVALALRAAHGGGWDHSDLSALDDNVPHRDLRVTKGHSLSFGAVLIPAEFLVNHRSIVWDDPAREIIEIYHVELPRHGVLLANGAAAESYRDDGNRWLFHNRNPGWTLPPQRPCAPVLTGGPVVDDICSGSWCALARSQASRSRPNRPCI
jgi:Hint domain